MDSPLLGTQEAHAFACSYRSTDMSFLQNSLSINFKFRSLLASVQSAKPSPRAQESIRALTLGYFSLMQSGWQVCRLNTPPPHSLSRLHLSADVI